MVPRSDSVPTGSPQANPIPHWFQWIHPDLRLHQNAMLVVARLHGFKIGNAQPRPGVRYSVWEWSWAKTWLRTIADGDETVWREILTEVYGIEKQMCRIVRQLELGVASNRKGGAA